MAESSLGADKGAGFNVFSLCVSFRTIRFHLKADLIALYSFEETGAGGEKESYKYTYPPSR